MYWPFLDIVMTMSKVIQWNWHRPRKTWFIIMPHPRPYTESKSHFCPTHWVLCWVFGLGMGAGVRYDNEPFFSWSNLLGQLLGGGGRTSRDHRLSTLPTAAHSVGLGTEAGKCGMIMNHFNQFFSWAIVEQNGSSSTPHNQPVNSSYLSDSCDIDVLKTVITREIWHLLQNVNQGPKLETIR